MTNPKIEKTKKEIVQTKAKIVEYQSKLRDLEQQKIDLENLEIIALYRKEKFSEEEFAALLHLQRKSNEI
jgi:DNA-binding transcriptional regulator YiaG